MCLCVCVSYVSVFLSECVREGERVFGCSLGDLIEGSFLLGVELVLKRFTFGRLCFGFVLILIF